MAILLSSANPEVSAAAAAAREILARFETTPFGLERPGGELGHRRAVDAVREIGIAVAASVETGAASPHDDPAARQSLEHAADV